MLMLRQIYLVNKKQIPLALFGISALIAERSQAVAFSKHIFESCREQFWVTR
jgi:hypothetical protein